MELDHNCTKAYGTRTYLHKGVQNCQGQEDHSSKGSRQQHDDEDLHQLEKVVQHHLQSFSPHGCRSESPTLDGSIYQLFKERLKV